MSLTTRDQLRRLDRKLKNELGAFIVSTLERPEVIEVCVNSDNRIWVEEQGKRLYETGETLDAEMLLAGLGTIAAMNDTEINKDHSILEGRMPLDGSRIEGTVPPTSPEGPALSIRKHASAIFPLSQYVEEGRITQQSVDYLRQAIQDRRNILVAGGTSSGKTTFVNALIKELLEISPQDRLVVMEDTFELQCATTNKQRFVSSDDVTLRTLLKTALRFRPDRIIVGEVRGAEALDLIKAWNTGHPGGISTVHANNAPAALLRLEQLVLEISVNPMSSLIAESIDVIVFMQQFGRIGRRVTEIIEVTGYREGGYQFRPVYELKTR